MTTGMITFFSLPGLPSSLSLRIAFASCEPWAMPRATPDVATKPSAERTDPNRVANALRVDLKSMGWCSFYDLELVRNCNDESSYVQPQMLDSSYFLDCLHDGFPLLDQGIHRMLFVIHLLGQSEDGLCVGFRDHGDAVTVSDDDVARVNGNPIAHHRHLPSTKLVVMHRSRRNNPGGKDRKADLTQVSNIAHTAVDHGASISADGHGGTHQSAHAGNIFTVFHDHYIHRVGRPLVNRFQHARQSLRITIALVFFELHSARIPGKFRRKYWLHAVSHIHPLVDDLLQRVGHRSDLDMPELRHQFAITQRSCRR